MIFLHQKKLFGAAGATVGLLAILGKVTPSAADEEAFPKQHISLAQKIELLQKKVKYVFVIYRENESFDHYFGTVPGANGLFTAPPGFRSAKRTKSFVQQYLNTSLNVATISPCLMPQAVTTASGQIVPIYPADEISIDHSHQGIANSLHVALNGYRGE